MLHSTPESLYTKLFRIGFNFFPAYRRTGGRVKFISSDWRLVKVSLRLKLTTRNYVGTVFGGSIYGALDPIYMIQLIKILGENYVVWDKAAEIKFKRPIKNQVSAEFFISNEFLNEIIEKVSLNNETTVDISVCFVDKDDNIYAEVTKYLYIAKKEFYKDKIGKKENRKSK